MKNKILCIILLVLLTAIALLLYLNLNKKVECNTFENEIKVDEACLSNMLGGMIADVENKTHYIDVREITNSKVINWKILKNDKVGAYAIIQSDEESAINDIKKYFEGIDKNYKYKNITKNYYVFISNGQDIDLDELNKCIK